jgi:putative hydrolase of the HAD superfamily
MAESLPITALFLDIGGVLLTDGWDHHIRRRAAETFGLNYDSTREILTELGLSLREL